MVCELYPNAIKTSHSKNLKTKRISEEKILNTKSFTKYDLKYKLKVDFSLFLLES